MQHFSVCVRWPYLRVSENTKCYRKEWSIKQTNKPSSSKSKSLSLSLSLSLSVSLSRQVSRTTKTEGQLPAVVRPVNREGHLRVKEKWVRPQVKTEALLLTLVT